MDHTIRGRLRDHVDIAVIEYARLGEIRSFDSVLAEVAGDWSPIPRMSDRQAQNALIGAIVLIATLRARCPKAGVAA